MISGGKTNMNDPFDDWVPSPSDIKWLENLIDTLSDGGVWAVPVMNGAFKVDKTNKVFVLIGGDEKTIFNPVVRRTKIILARMGWKMEWPKEAYSGPGQ
jgi:hypothetical protein